MGYQISLTSIIQNVVEMTLISIQFVYLEAFSEIEILLEILEKN